MMGSDLVSAVAFGGVAAGATLLGGALALRLRRRLGMLLAFGCGVVLGVALLDLFPEALALGEASISHTVTVLTALLGCALYFALGTIKSSPTGAPASWLSQVNTASLVLHSILDGFGIGSAFQASNAIGLAVAAGVIAHDLVDGANAVAFSLGGGASPRIVRRWLLVDGLAPIGGILLSAAVRPPAWGVSAVLALMTGGFIYIGISVGIRPLSSGPIFRALGLGAAGLLFVFAVVQFTTR